MDLATMKTKLNIVESYTLYGSRTSLNDYNHTRFFSPVAKLEVYASTSICQGLDGQKTGREEAIADIAFLQDLSTIIRRVKARWSLQLEVLPVF